MTNLKTLRARLASVQSTKRITSAMKVVAAAKLRHAKDAMEKALPYKQGIEYILQRVGGRSIFPHPLTTTGAKDRHLLVAVFSDRGLCGGLNSALARSVVSYRRSLEKVGKKTQVLVVGRKGIVPMRHAFSDDVIHVYEHLAKPFPQYNHAEEIFSKIEMLLEKKAFDVCILFYNVFISTFEHAPKNSQIIPFNMDDFLNQKGGHMPRDSDVIQGIERMGGSDFYTFESGRSAVLEMALPAYLKAQIFGAMLENFAAEQTARILSMDNAKRNASDIIDRTTIAYNKARQAQITKELTEIISGL